MKLAWSPLAIQRVAEAASYIAQDSPLAADRWVDGLFKAVERLADFPESGRVVPEIAEPALRELLYHNYRVIYRFTGDEVRVLTVRHGRRLLDDSELDE
jgi:plasmid stabilization system protein ParE